jgi:hypothetical protein
MTNIIETQKATNPEQPRCIVCGEEGKPAVCQRIPIQPKGQIRKVRLAVQGGGSFLVDSGDLAHGNMVGPQSPPENFPGDPTGKKYFGSGAGAYVYYHPECWGQSLESYNAFLRTFAAQMADDEEWVYEHEKPASEGPWRGTQAGPMSRVRAVLAPRASVP